MVENANNHKPVANRLLDIGIAIIILIIFYFLPVNQEALPIQGKMALGLLVAAVYLWVTEPIPMGVTALAAMVLMPVFGVLNYAEVWTGWISSVIFFVLASFALTKAMLKTKIPAKLVFQLLRISRGKSVNMVLAFMISCACISMFISDLPCTAIFAGLAMSTIIEAGGYPIGKSNLAKCLMIGISFGSMIGGMSTPIGTAMNIMVLGMLKSATGIEVTFLKWMAMALPVALITLPVSWLVLIKIFKPEPLKESTQAIIAEKAENLGPLDVVDKKMIGVFCFLLICWIASNWTGWDATAISVMGMVIMFLPGIDLLTWQEFVDGVSWNVVLLIGGVQSLAGGMSAKGASAWLIGSTVTKLAFSAAGFLAGAAVFLPLLRLIIPVAPALIAITTIPLLGIAQKTGVSAVLIAMLIAMETNTFLLALDNNVMMSYRHGCYTIIDYFKAGIIPTMVLVVLCTTLLPFMVRLMGY